MTVDQMREKITDAYSGLGWKDRVARMEDDQVIAIYHTCEERGVFEKTSACRSLDGRRVKQLSIDDILGKGSRDWECQE